MRKILFVLFLLILLHPVDALCGQTGDPFKIRAASYLLEVEGKTLWARNPAKKLPPASLTKIMTAHIALNRGRLDDVVTVSAEATRETGFKLRIRKGDRFSLEALLEAALLYSSNDACHAIADHIAGSEKAFVEMMNVEAARLGLFDTHFTNACGHDNADHYSTAGDLARLASVALKDRSFAEIVSRPSSEIRTIDGKRTYRIRNTNKLVGRYPGAAGIKTGFTAGAGRCLIALAKRDGKEALLILLNAPQRWASARTILDRGFATGHL